MPVSPELLDVLEYVAAGKTALSGLAQENIAVTAASAKSSSGDRVLAQLARRDDLTQKTRDIIASSPRAAAKAAWLSRTDHPEGYVEAAIAKEKRVTVLASVAAHPDSTDALLTALSQSGHIKVAEAIIKRAEAPAEALVHACAHLLNNVESTSYRQAYELTQVVLGRAELLEDIISRVDTPEGLWFLADSNNLRIPEKYLEKVASAVCANWEDKLPETVTRWSAHTSAYTRAISQLLANPDWDATSRFDAVFADIIERVGVAGGGFSSRVQNCYLRHKGSATEQEAAQAEARARTAALEEARSTRDSAKLVKYLTSNDSATANAASTNPHIGVSELDQVAKKGHYGLQQASTTALLLRLLEQGEDPVHLAALCIALVGRAYSYVPEAIRARLDEGDIAKVGRKAAELFSASDRRRYSIGLLRDRAHPELFAGIVPALSISELRLALVNDYTGDEVKTRIAELVARVLDQGLTEPDAWKTFIALAGQGNEPIEDAVKVASLV